MTPDVCENSSFEKIRTIPINLIQLHYFDDVVNEFNMIDLAIRWMSCDFNDLKQETINYEEVNLENLFFLLYLTGRATWLPIVPYCVEWATDGLPIVGSPLEASDKSCLKNNTKYLWKI